MSIDKHCGRDDQLNDHPGSQAEAHSLIALEQSALYATRLAIARWINNSAASTPPIAPPAALSRAIWYAQAQHNFQEWLGRGGFAQYDMSCAEPSAAATATTLDGKPLADTCVD